MQDLRSYVADHLKEEIAAEATIQNISSFAELILAHGKVGEIVYELLQPKEGLVSNMAELFEELTQKGVPIISPMQSSGGDQKWGIISDPEGNLIEIAGTG